MDETTTLYGAQIRGPAIEAPEPIRYCLCARKSSEAEEKQALSIDSQVKEMLTLAQRDGLNVVDMYRESHSAKDAGQRPVFNQLLLDIRGTWIRTMIKGFKGGCPYRQASEWNAYMSFTLLGDMDSNHDKELQRLLSISANGTREIGVLSRSVLGD